MVSFRLVKLREDVRLLVGSAVLGLIKLSLVLLLHLLQLLLDRLEFEFRLLDFLLVRLLLRLDQKLELCLSRLACLSVTFSDLLCFLLLPFDRGQPFLEGFLVHRGERLRAGCQLGQLFVLVSIFLLQRSQLFFQVLQHLFLHRGHHAIRARFLLSLSLH